MGNTKPSRIPTRTVGWHREDVKAEIRKRGKTLADLSREHGFDSEAVSVALRRRWAAVEKVIAEFLDVAPADLWPDRYTPDNKPKRRRAPKEAA